MAGSSPSPEELEDFNSLIQPQHANVAGTLRGMVDPRTWSRDDWITTIAPLVVEGAAALAPEITLPLIGAVDLAKAFKLVSNSAVGRTAMNAAIPAITKKLEGGSWGEAGQAGATGGVLNLLSEGPTGVAKLIGQRAGGGFREKTLSQSSEKLRNSITKKLPLLSHAMKGRPSEALFSVFGRERLQGHGSPAERMYGEQLDHVEDNIGTALATRQRKASLHTRRLAMQAGKPLAGGITTIPEELFPVHVMDAKGRGWSIQKLPFKEAVAAMKQEWPRGYTLTGKARDTAVGDEWRKFKVQDRKAISSHLRTVDPDLADDWQHATHNWELSNAFATMFSDPKSKDTVTGEVNSQHLAKHLYGDAGAGMVNQKIHIGRIGGSDFAREIHGAVTHQRPRGYPMKDVGDILKSPDEAKARIGVSPHFPFVHLSMHPPTGEFFPRGTELPWSEQGRVKVPFSIMRALGRHTGEQAKEGFMGEDDAKP